MDGIEHTIAIDVHQKYIRNILNGRAGRENFFSSCYAAIFTRQSSRAVTLARPVYFGTEATPLSSRGGEKENDRTDITYINVSTALSLLNIFQLHLYP